MNKKVISLLTAFFLGSSALIGTSSQVNAENLSINIYRNDGEYLIEKVSNPYTVSGNADGLENGGDRENSYAWSMQEMEDEYGDYIYIGSNRNILYAALSSFMSGSGDSEIMKSLVDTITNGELKTDTSPVSFAQASIFRYNVKTNSMETYFDSADYTSGVYSYVSGFRACMPFKNSLYFNANGTSNSMIWRVSNNNQETPEVVFNQPGGYMRAMTVSSDEETMYIGGTDKNFDNVMDDSTAYKINIYSTTDGNSYQLIADYNDFKQYEKEGYFSTGGDVWDRVEYNGSLYLTLMTLHGAVVYEAHKASESESEIANKYGWVWTDIVGETDNSIYSAGFGNSLNYAASPYVFNNDLYFITFSNAMDSIIYGAYGLLSMFMSEQPDMEVFFNSLKMMKANMDNETSVFRLTSDGKMQMVVGDEKNCPSNIEYSALIGAGFNNDDYSTTQYNWRAAVYNGKLYIGTFDAYAMYKYLTKLTNGDLFEMKDEEYRQQLEYAIKFITLISSENNNVAKYSIDNGTEEDDESTKIRLAAKIYNLFMNDDLKTTFSTEANILAENQEESERKAPNNSFTDDEINDLIDSLVYIHSNIDGEATTEAVSKILNSIKVHDGSIASISDSIQEIIDRLNDLKDSMDEDIYKESIEALTSVLNSLKTVLDVFRNVDQEGVDCYVKVSDVIAANDTPGFELYCTEDGRQYDTVTINGFNDEYNYGCRTLLVGSNGLYLGTANPFYGAQLWRINEKTADLEEFTCNIDEINSTFDKNITEYTVEVDNDLTEFKFTLIPADKGNTIYLNKTPLEKWSGSTQLNVGKNTITVENVSIDGSESTVYTFNIIRAEEKKVSPDSGESNKDNEITEGTKGVSVEETYKAQETSVQSSLKTGDSFNIVLYAVLVIASGGLILCTIKRKRV